MFSSSVLLLILYNLFMKHSLSFTMFIPLIIVCIGVYITFTQYSHRMLKKGETVSEQNDYIMNSLFGALLYTFSAFFLMLNKENNINSYMYLMIFAAIPTIIFNIFLTDNIKLKILSQTISDKTGIMLLIVSTIAIAITKYLTHYLNNTNEIHTVTAVSVLVLAKLSEYFLKDSKITMNEYMGIILSIIGVGSIHFLNE